MSDPSVATILLATDLSARCDRATERAVALARHWRARLHVLTVLDPFAQPQDVGVAEAAVAEVLRKAGDGPGEHDDAEIHVLIGPAETAIAELARRVDADLIVTGPSGGKWLGQTVLGGTITSLMRLARLPVLLVKAPVTGTYRRVVVSIDLSDASRAPVETAFRLLGRDVSLSIFHAFSTPFRLMVDDVGSYEAGVREGVTLEIRDALKAWSVADAATVPVIADYGDPATKLDELVARHDIDLVVTGTHGRTGLMNLMLGSVAEAIVERVTCDILVAPSRGAWSA